MQVEMPLYLEDVPASLAPSPSVKSVRQSDVSTSQDTGSNETTTNRRATAPIGKRRIVVMTPHSYKKIVKRARRSVSDHQSIVDALSRGEQDCMTYPVFRHIIVLSERTAGVWEILRICGGGQSISRSNLGHHTFLLASARVLLPHWGLAHLHIGR